MSESKHTSFDPKGPYTLRERYTVRSPRIERIDLVDADGDVVASILADDTEEVENCTILEVVSKRGKATARFFRAAPEMLEALRKSRWFEAICGGACTRRGQPLCVDCEIRAAIAAATGGEQ